MERVGTSEYCVLCKCGQLALCNNNYKLSGVLWDRILACGQSCVSVPIYYSDLLLIMMQNPGLFSSHGTSALIIRTSPLGTRDRTSEQGTSRKEPFFKGLDPHYLHFGKPMFSFLKQNMLLLLLFSFFFFLFAEFCLLDLSSLSNLVSSHIQI